MLSFPDINPVALQLGPFAIRWYALAYIVGFLGAYQYFKYMLARHPLAGYGQKQLDQLFMLTILGVIIGGRLGFVLFYNLGYYLNNPLEIIKTWEGGMAFHGGLIGVAIALFIHKKLSHTDAIDIADRIAPGVCIGLFFGRIANFINGELWGRVTDAPWGMVFPYAGPLPRHPSQLYEAALEGLVLFVILHLISRYSFAKYRNSGVFLMGYGVFRFIIEYFREPDAYAQVQGGLYSVISQGQLLCIPMILLGLWLIFISFKRRT